MGVGRNFKISQESLMGNLISVGFPAVVFSTECCIIMVSFNYDRSL